MLAVKTIPSSIKPISAPRSRGPVLLVIKRRNLTDGFARKRVPMPKNNQELADAFSKVLLSLGHSERLVDSYSDAIRNSKIDFAAEFKKKGGLLHLESTHDLKIWIIETRVTGTLIILNRILRRGVESAIRQGNADQRREMNERRKAYKRETERLIDRACRMPGFIGNEAMAMARDGCSNRDIEEMLEPYVRKYSQGD